MSEWLHAPVQGMEAPFVVQASRHADLLQRRMFPQGITTVRDLHLALLLDSACPLWERFISREAELFVRRRCRDGDLLNRQDQALLVAIVAHDGLIRSATHLQVVLTLIEGSVSVLGSLILLAVDQLRLMLEGADGGYKKLYRFCPRGMTRRDADYVSRLVEKTRSADQPLLFTSLLRKIEAIGRAAGALSNDRTWQDLVDRLKQEIFPPFEYRRPWLDIAHLPPTSAMDRLEHVG